MNHTPPALRPAWRLSATTLASLLLAMWRATQPLDRWALGLHAGWLSLAAFLNLAQVLFRPHKVHFTCPACGLTRHDPDAAHCKACGVVLNIPDEGHRH